MLSEIEQEGKGAYFARGRPEDLHRLVEQAKGFSPLIKELIATTLENAGITVPNAYNVLDLGCGDGHGLVDQLSKYFGGTLCGLDFDPTKTDAAQKAVDAAGLRDRSNIYLADAHRLPELFDAGSIDAMMAVHFWEHIRKDEREGLMEEVVRSLRPGGVAFWMDLDNFEGQHDFNNFTGHWRMSVPSEALLWLQAAVWDLGEHLGIDLDIGPELDALSARHGLKVITNLEPKIIETPGNHPFARVHIGILTEGGKAVAKFGIRDADEYADRLAQFSLEVQDPATIISTPLIYRVGVQKL